MNDIEIGDYVRDNSGLIGQLIRIERDDIDTSLKWYVIFDGKNEIYINKPYITKHSKNIIDLIEVGDFVNNGYIHEVGSADNGERWVHNLNGLLLYKEDIKTILTKEQYMQNCYTVKKTKKC